MTTLHFNLDEVLVTAMGVPVMEFQEGDSVAVEYTEDDWTVVQGHGGMVMRAKRPNAIAEMTLSLMQGSLSLDLIRQAADADRLTGRGALPSSVVDTNGQTRMSCEASWLKKPMSIGFATEPGAVEVVLVCSGAKIAVGSNRLV